MYISTINGANQSGNRLLIHPHDTALKTRDLITIAGVKAINRSTKKVLNSLRQFIVLENNGTTIDIYPSITKENVDKLPVDNAVITRI